MSTSQMIFDRVTRHLLTQKRRAISNEPDACTQVCRYRGPGETKCAIGCLISDKHYSPDLEGLAVGSEKVRKALCESLGYALSRLSERDLLCRLQQVHDCLPILNWPVCLRDVAQEKSLSTAVLDTEFKDWQP